MSKVEDEEWARFKTAAGPPTYRATAERDGRFWLLRIPERELVTQAIRLEQAEDMVRDLIATVDQVPPDSFDVRISVKLDETTDEAVEALEHIRRLDALAGELTRLLAVTLVREQGLTLRDAGKILGLSHQRVDQLLAERDAQGDLDGANLELLVALVDHRSATRAGMSVTIRPGDGPEKLEQARTMVIRGTETGGIAAKSSTGRTHVQKKR